MHINICLYIQRIFSEGFLRYWEHWNQGGKHWLRERCGSEIFTVYPSVPLKFHPGWCASVDWAPAWELNDCQFNSLSGHRPGLWARSPFGGEQEATNWCLSHTSMIEVMFFSLSSPSLLLSLKTNKIFN